MFERFTADARQDIVGQGAHEQSGHIPFSAGAKKVLEMSLRECNELRQDHIGAEHILLGLIREGEGVAATLPIELGAELTRVRRKIVESTQG